jgi:hypothetical protein
VLSRQQQRIAEQEKIIRHLRGKIGGNKVKVEDVEILAQRRLPKLVENLPCDYHDNDDGDTVVNEKSDNDSAIHLEIGFDSLHQTEEETKSRNLHRSVSDVVQTNLRYVRMSGVYRDLFPREKVSPFCDKIYRGFLLRHKKRQKYWPDKQPVSLSPGDADS